MTDGATEAASFFQQADVLFSDRPHTNLPLQMQCCTGPVQPTLPYSSAPEARLRVIQEFFDSCLSIFTDALNNKCSRDLYRWLLNDTPASLRRRWHLALPRAVYTRPMFFRTDESPAGQVMEIQCPGSGWGDLCLLRDAYLSFSTTCRRGR